MINRIMIENFRSIKKITINNIENFLAFIGENSSGKSTIISALLVALGDQKVEINDFRHDGVNFQASLIRIGISIELDKFALQRILNDFSLKQRNPDWYSNALQNSKGQGKRKRRQDTRAFLKDFRKNLEIEFSHTIYNHNFYFCIEFNKDNYLNPSFKLMDRDFKHSLNDSISSIEIGNLMRLMQPRFAYLKDERGFQNESMGLTESTTNKLFTLLLPSMNKIEDLSGKDVDEVPISQLSIKQINDYMLQRLKIESKSITDNLNENFSDFQTEIKVSWEFTNSLFENMNIRTNFQIGFPENLVDFQSVGSGTRSMYKLILLHTLLNEQTDEDEPVLFLLEEPELYLYPKLEKQMAEFIQNISKRNQVFLTTHSPTTIINMSDENVYKVERVQRSRKSLPITQINRLDTTSEVMGLLGYDVTFFLGKDYLIFVEGKDDKEAYGALISKVFGKETRNLVYTMTSVSKFSAALHFKFLGDMNSTTKFIYILDSDGGESEILKDKVVEDFRRHNNSVSREELREKILITRYSMLECYTFERRFLKTMMSEEDFVNAQGQFLLTHINQINKLLRTRKVREIELTESSSADKIAEEFEYVRKFGFNKNLVKKFRQQIGGSGFKRLKELQKEELEDACSDLIVELERYIDR